MSSTQVQKIIFLIFCVAAFALTCPADGHEALPPTKKVLVFGREPYSSTVQIAEEAIKQRIQDNKNHRIEFYRESLEALRIPDEKFDPELLTLLQRKYEKDVPDLIFVLGIEPLKFLLRHEATLFSNVPKVYVLSEERLTAGMDLGQNTTGVTGKVEFVPTVALMLAQNPGTKKIWVITGSTDQNVAFRNQAKAALAAFAERVEFIYPEAETVEQLRDTLSALPRDNLALFVAFGGDSTGRGFKGPEVVELLAPTSAVPVYAVSDHVIGSGAVGGSVLSFRTLSVAAAEMGLRILDGEPLTNIPPRLEPNVPMFDWREVKKWGIDEVSLPVGSIVRFKEPTAWEKYRWEIVGLFIFTVFQTLLIGWLLFLRERKKTAEIESSRFAALARGEHQKLGAVVANVPGIVWESRMDAATDDRQIEFVSDYVEKMLGYTPEEVASRPNFWMSVVHEDDRELVAHAIKRIFEDRKTGAQEFRCIKKDGTQLWVNAYMVPNYDGSGKVVGIRGVTIDVTDRKLAEDDLYNRDFELREAQRLSQIGNWDWDPATDTVHWSEELYRIAGLDPRNPPPDFFTEHEKFYTSESYERLAAVVAKALEKGGSYELELEMIRADGRHIWTHARGEALLDEDLKVIKLRGTLQDISARKKAEEALAEGEERYRNVVETQTEMICRYLPDTTLTFVNGAYCRFFGRTSEQLVGTKFIELIPPDARRSVLDHVKSLVVNPRTEIYEHEVVGPTGQRAWQQWTDHVVVAPGKTPELQGIGRDVTEKRRIEEALRLSENRFRTMADHAPVLIWICGPDQLCTYVNQGWLDFTGRSLEKELGTGWMVGMYKDDRNGTRAIFDSAFERREPFTAEYRLRRFDGEYRWIFTSGTPRFSSDGEFLGYIGSCVDISQRREDEDALRKALDEVRDLQKELHAENIYLREVIELKHNFDELIGHSDALRYVLYKIEQVAKTEATVLITGETGTGKELVARAIHNTSVRKAKPLVTVNCAALSATLIESELFGHERGAFTGASVRKIGRFELADGATIFLDEIGELPLELQPKLLRVIQEGEFERLGGSKTVKVDVRIIAATNRNMDAEVKKGNFREDLLFRLNVFPITVPPLRERKEDIPELVEYFAARSSKKLGKSIRTVSPVTIRRLAEYSWPGNIRELANVIERSVIDSQGDMLTIYEDLGGPASNEASPPSNDTLEAVERKHIKKVLIDSDWKIEGVNGAARVLGMNPSTLRTRMAKLGISKRQSESSKPRITL